MKKNLIYIITLLLGVGLAGCDDGFDPDGNLEPSLSPHWLKPSQTSFTNDLSSAFSETFTIESYETPWRFSDVAEWISLSVMSGNESASVTLTAEENQSVDNARTAIFYLRSESPDWNYNRAMSVSQAKATPSLSAGETSLTFDGKASQQVVSITANCRWTASCSDSWVSLSSDVDNGKLTVYVTDNTQDSYRSSFIYLSYGDNGSASIKITQSPASITSSTYSLQFENFASKYDVTIDAETDWTTTVSDSWINVSPDKGKAGKTSVSIEVAPNTAIASRSGYVAINTGTSERLQIAIIQKGIYIEADEEITFASIEDSKKLNIKSNTTWTVTDKPNWITLSKESGEGNSEITITAADNPNTTSRTSQIVLSQVGLSIECRIKVTQMGKSLSMDVTVLEFSDKAEQKTFNIISDASWTSTKTAEWFNSTPTSGRGNASITVTAGNNNTTDERTGKINYAFLDKTTQVTVHQLAKYMTIDNQAFEFDSHGGTHTIELLTNDEWTAQIEDNASWLKLSKSSGSESAVITLTADDNASVNERSAVVIINAKASQSVRILVSQKPRHLSVSASSISFFATGGTSDPITIDTDGSYEIKSDASWFSINMDVKNTFTVKASQNSSNQIRRGTITISLTGLKEGSLALELTVMQTGQGGSFIINGYPSDKNWDNSSGGSVTFTINGYTSDKNWDDPYGATFFVKKK